jgi:hypothetical protein
MLLHHRGIIHFLYLQKAYSLVKEITLSHLVYVLQPLAIA